MAAKRLGIRNRIHQVGVELEGGWRQMPKGMKKEHLTYDGSVKFPNLHGWIPTKIYDITLFPPEIRQLPVTFIGEIPSPILTMDNYKEWMQAHYPQHVNETCGLHTHVSFKSKLNYMRLMTPDFTKFIVEGLINWAEEEKFPKDHGIWKRLLKKSHDHCAHVYLGDNQVNSVKKDFNSRGKPHSRYTALNYCWAYMIEKGYSVGTVECRLLPMMETPEQAIRAVSEVFSLTNKFLSKVRYKELRHQAVVALAPAAISRYRVKI